MWLRVALQRRLEARQKIVLSGGGATVGAVEMEKGVGHGEGHVPRPGCVMGGVTLVTCHCEKNP